MKRKKKFQAYIAFFVCVLTLWISLCSEIKASSREQIFKKLTAHDTIEDVYRINVPVKGVKGSYRYLVINDSHIIVPGAEITDNDMIAERQQVLQNANGRLPVDTFPELMRRVDAMKLDGIILNGDIIDEYTAANLRALYQSVRKVHTPIMYLRSDHDTKSWWAGNVNKKKAKVYAKRLEMTANVLVIENSELVLAGWNDSYKNIKTSQKTRIKKLLSGKKPVVLFSHVPFAMRKNADFSQFVMERRNQRMYWGKDGMYKTNASMKSFLKLLYQDKNRPMAVITGHIHSPYRGELRKGVPQYVCPTFFGGSVTLLTVGNVKN